MIDLSTAIAAVAIALSGHLVQRAADDRQARARAIAWMASTLALSFLLTLVVSQLKLPSLPAWIAFAPAGGFRRAAPLVTLAVGLIAVAMAPMASHPRKIMSLMVALIATALGALSIEQIQAFAGFFCLSIVLFHRGLTRAGTDPGAARIFLRMHGLSGAAMIVAALAGLGDQTALLAGAWLIATGIREAVIPAHGWLPRVMDRAPLGLVVAFIAPQMGVVGHMVHLAEGVPPADAHLVATFAALTGLLGAALSVSAKEARRAVAWLLISQTGLLAFGIESASEVGREGAVMMWEVMALATSGFVMTVAAIESRRGPLRLGVPGGSFAKTPRMAVGFLILGLASVGLPATTGFVAEDLLLQGTAEEHPLLACSLILTTALNAISVLRAFFSLFSGSNHRVGEMDLTRREWGAITLAMGLLFLGGLFPWLLLA